MKALSLVFILVFFASKLFSQENIFPVDSITRKISYSEIIKVDSVNAQELFIRAKEWFVHSFNSAKNVIQLDDKEAGRIIGKGLFDVKTSLLTKTDAGFVEFTVDIQVKDGRYKYSFTDFWHKSGGSGISTPGDLRLEKPGGGLVTMGLKNWQGIKQQTHETVMNMIESLKGVMGTKNDSGNW